MSSGGLDLSRSKNAHDLLFIGFNQDQSCFAVGCSTGFRIYNCSPFRVQLDRVIEGGGIRHVEMLFRCNLFALVGAANNGRFPPNQVIIWDDQLRKEVGELSFRHEVKAVRLRRDMVVAVLEFKVMVYRFADLSFLLELDTVANPKGICALSSGSQQTVLACPGSQRGHVRLELMDQRRTHALAAHTSPLSCLALNLDGSRLVTASEKGTILRVFDTGSGRSLQELRRGAGTAAICSLTFNPPSTLLSCSSERGTVHVFCLSDGEPAASHDAPAPAPDAPAAPAGGGTSAPAASASPPHAQPAGGATSGNYRSSLSLLGGVVGYFNSEWSFAKVRLPDGPEFSISSFAPEPNTLMVVTSLGTAHLCSFKPDGPSGQECSVSSSFSFLPAPPADDA